MTDAPLDLDKIRAKLAPIHAQALNYRIGLRGATAAMLSNAYVENVPKLVRVIEDMADEIERLRIERDAYKARIDAALALREMVFAVQSGTVYPLDVLRWDRARAVLTGEAT